MVNFVVANCIVFAVDANGRHIVDMGVVVDIVVFEQGLAKQTKKG